MNSGVSVTPPNYLLMGESDFNHVGEKQNMEEEN